MRNMGITSGDIPFFTITYGEEKEYEIWMNAAKVIKKELDNIIVVAGGLGLQDMENDTGMEIDEGGGREGGRGEVGERREGGEGGGEGGEGEMDFTFKIL
ncbi:hypothetical protein Glove_226g34 [Diversispora epigaea]|uniref:Uncharacterized protein n=1 Tax=Diversispora epigaea TaxID=1348612 RepID=A0A397IMX7_9GLOM|nr:hypothetical protein Glove_226g34 [Diversispora epigaea]